MLTPRTLPARLTVTEFDRLLELGAFDEGRPFELIRGALCRLCPTAVRHQKALDALEDWSRADAPSRFQPRVQLLLGMPEFESIPEPDLAWVDRRPYGGMRPGGADVRLLVEVAGASLRHDRTTKARLYAEARIPDYWVVNLPQRCVEVFRVPGPDGYARQFTLRDGATIAPLEAPRSSLEVAEIFHRFSDSD